MSGKVTFEADVYHFERGGNWRWIKAPDTAEVTRYRVTLEPIEDEPLTCPFCGAEAQIGHFPDAGPDCRWSVACRRLSCQAEIVNGTKAEAIADWNKRV